MAAFGRDDVDAAFRGGFLETDTGGSSGSLGGGLSTYG
jgi:hypothetical protein